MPYEAEAPGCLRHGTANDLAEVVGPPVSCSLRIEGTVERTSCTVTHCLLTITGAAEASGIPGTPKDLSSWAWFPTQTVYFKASICNASGTADTIACQGSGTIQAPIPAGTCGGVEVHAFYAEGGTVPGVPVPFTASVRKNVIVCNF